MSNLMVFLWQDLECSHSIHICTFLKCLVHFLALMESFWWRFTSEFLRGRESGWDPPPAEHAEGYKAHLCLPFLFACLLCVLMVLPQARSTQSFSATKLLLFFAYNMNNLTSGMHAVWLWLISDSDYWETSTSVAQSLFSWILRHLFHRRQNFQGLGQTPSQMARE